MKSPCATFGTMTASDRASWEKPGRDGPQWIASIFEQSPLGTLKLATDKPARLGHEISNWDSRLGMPGALL